MRTYNFTVKVNCQVNATGGKKEAKKLIKQAWKEEYGLELSDKEIVLDKKGK